MPLDSIIVVLASIVAGWVLIEISLWALIRSLRPKFQWLITAQDETPVFESALIEKYRDLSFDADLGWKRLPQTTGREETALGVKTFAIAADGCRLNPDWHEKPSQVAVFGDSFSFCRLVGDDETWPHYLSKFSRTNVRNFGVGNYGFDQALLRFEQELETLDADHVVMGVVPETLSRVHSYWRHYFEYGNILAFKPRFELDGDALVHVPPAVRDVHDFQRIGALLPEIRAQDLFYRRKFKLDLLRFPYSFHILHRARRVVPILFWLLHGKLGGRFAYGYRQAFGVVLRENERLTDQLYQEPEARRLLGALICRFARKCASANKKPYLVILPQPVDLARQKMSGVSYSEFYAEMASVLPVLDMTQMFAAHSSDPSLYVEGGLGPHPSPHGNEMIAREVMKLIGEL